MKGATGRPAPRGRTRRLAARVALLLAAACAVAPLAGAQHAGFTPSDVPAGPAAIRGRVVHPDRAGAQAGVEVVLYALPASGVPGLRRVTTDASGAFAFEGVSNAPDVAYLVGARIGEIPFPGERIAFAAGETEKTTQIRVADPTPDPSQVSVLESRVRLDRSGAGATVTETHRLANRGTRVVFVPAGDRERAKAALRVDLPPGAGAVQHPLGMKPEGLVATADGDLAFFGPVYPGEQEITFSYDVPLAAGEQTLRKRFASAAGRVLVLADAALGSVRAKGLASVDPVALDGRSYRAEEARGVAAGTAFDLVVAPAPARDDPSALEVSEVRQIIDFDDAAVTVQEDHRIHVSEGAPLLGSAERPLLRIPLPEGAEDLRFATASAGLGLAPDPNGGLQVLGPLAAGDTAIQIQYRLPVREGAVDLARRYDRPFPLLTVYVADSGIVAGSERLHRRRPVMTEDRAYLHLEGFEIGAGETVPLRLAALPPGGGAPAWAEVALVALLAAGAVGLLAAPVVGRPAAGQEALAPPPARRERDSLYTALRDLEDDFEAGKIDEADYASLRDDLRARAVVLLQAEREAARAAVRPPDAEAAAQASAAPAACGRCGSAPREGDRFCGRCGAPLDAGARGREATA